MNEFLKDKIKMLENKWSPLTNTANNVEYYCDMAVLAAYKEILKG